MYQLKVALLAIENNDAEKEEKKNTTTGAARKGYKIA